MPDTRSGINADFECVLHNTTLEIDSKTGYYADSETKKPTWDTGIVVTSTPVNLDDFKSLIVIDDSNYIATANGFENFTLDRIKELGYFNQTLPNSSF